MNAQGKPPVKVRFRDLSVTKGPFRETLKATFERVLSHGQLIMGKEVEEFERIIASYCGTKYSVGVSSGTNAIYLALKALGVGEGDEVITTPMSWVATLNAVAISGATPVFADIREDLNIDPDAVEAAITDKTKAILPVHYTGRLCDMDRLTAIAEKHNLLVIEDAASGAKGEFQEGESICESVPLPELAKNGVPPLSEVRPSGRVFTSLGWELETFDPWERKYI